MKLPLQSIVFVLLCFIVIRKDRGVKTQMLYPLFFFFFCALPLILHVCTIAFPQITCKAVYMPLVQLWIVFFFDDQESIFPDMFFSATCIHVPSKLLNTSRGFCIT